MNFLNRAQELNESIVRDRRAIHTFGGTAYDLDQSCTYIKNRLESLNISYKEIVKCGLVATVGSGTPVFLLRADYDALPMSEKSGLPFSCTNGTCHSCGHDFHSSMLLCAAQMLKERESELKGTVKLVFQPAEEGAGGCQSMVDNGVLESPEVDAAMAIHMAIGNELSKSCTAHYSRGTAFSGGAGVRIVVKGKGGHGAQPFTACDPISAAAHILVALEHILAFEVKQGERVALTFGTIKGGTAANIITDTVEITGTCRTCSKEMSQFMEERIKAISEDTARGLRVEAEVSYKQIIEPVINNNEVGKELYPFIQEVVGPGNLQIFDYPTSFGGEDFSVIASKVPSIIVKLGGGSISEGYQLPLHHPAAVFNEKALPYGASIYANCAYQWLDKHSSR